MRRDAAACQAIASHTCRSDTPPLARPASDSRPTGSLPTQVVFKYPGQSRRIPLMLAFSHAIRQQTRPRAPAYGPFEHHRHTNECHSTTRMSDALRPANHNKHERVDPDQPGRGISGTGIAVTATQADPYSGTRPGSAWPDLGRPGSAC